MKDTEGNFSCPATGQNNCTNCGTRQRMKPLVSIIIPCYNKLAYVAASIESALAQGDIVEVIVIDDGSTDGSDKILAGYGDRIVSEFGPNRGGSAARNRGLELAQGSYIQFLDADDILPEGKIAAQVAMLKDTARTEMAFCPWAYFYDDGRIQPTIPRRYWHCYDAGLNLLVDMWTYGGFFPNHAWLVPMGLIEEAGPWDETLSGDDDGEFFGRLLARAGRLHFCKETSVFYRDPPERSVSRDLSLKSALSFWVAFEKVAGVILSCRTDRLARRAVLSRVRTTAYAWRNRPEIIENAAEYEKKLDLWDLSPSLPLGARWILAIFGIRHGLAVRRILLAERTASKTN